MQFPKLSQLQSRFAASLTASLLLLLVYLSLSKPHFAYAADLDSRIPSDHNHPIIYDAELAQEATILADGSSIAVKLEARQGNILSLKNNQAQNRDIISGQTQYWVFPKSEIDGPAGERGRGLPADSVEFEEVYPNIELRKRQSQIQVYVSINVCLQPVSLNPNSTDLDDIIPPQLLLFYSQSTQNPGPSSNGDVQQVIVDGGYSLVNLTTDSDLYVGIAAVNGSGFSGQWNYEIAGSIDTPYHSVELYNPFLHFVDADTHAALFITDNLTQEFPNSTVYQEWMNMTPPFGMFGHPQNDPSILGVHNSYCGLMHSASILVNLQDVDNQNVASMTTRGLGSKPKEQFYITSLNASSNYWGFLAMQGNSTASGLDVVGGGGKVWPQINFSTKADSNCALLYNLSFCSELAYSVPSNPDLFSPLNGLQELAQIYDDNAATLYQNFNYSLQQIPCNTTSSAQYSLARNCDDCARAYKQWLCAVTIPRCEDFSNPATYLQPRNVAQPFPNGTTLPSTPGLEFQLTRVANNQSRNLLIDTEIKPGPYKEVLPCDDLCYDLVQSCPAALGFGCPVPGPTLNDSYGFRSKDGSQITCSWLGAAYYLSGGGRLGVGVSVDVLVGLAVGLGFLMSV